MNQMSYLVHVVKYFDIDVLVVPVNEMINEFVNNNM